MNKYFQNDLLVLWFDDTLPNIQIVANICEMFCDFVSLCTWTVYARELSN